MSDYMAILHTTCIRVSLYNVFIIGRSKNTALLLNGILLNDFLKQTVSNKIIHVFYIFFLWSKKRKTQLQNFKLVHCMSIHLSSLDYRIVCMV